MLFDQGKLEKMTIRAFRPTTCPDDVPQLSDDPKLTYVVQINPASYTFNRRLNYAERQGQGDSASDAVFSSGQPTTMNFNFVFDATGVVPRPSELGDIPLAGAIASALTDEEYVVMDEIEKFSHVVYDYSGEIHRPRKLLLVWGVLSFTCALTSVSFEFKLFKPDGTPLRAQATCAFQEALTDCERELAEANSSPDLTHLREVREGDKLPLMSHQVYGDSKYYIAVARHNKIVDFRRLKPGARLAMPRLDSKGVKA